MPTGLTVDIDRFDELIEAFDDGADEYLEQLHEQTVEQIMSNMARGKDAMGRRWEPTQDPTDNSPLVDSGELMASIKRKSRQVGDTVIFDAGVGYAKYHEFGAPGAGIPPRPFLQPGLEYALDITPEVFHDTVDKKAEMALY